MNLYNDFLTRLQATSNDIERAQITLQFNLDNQSEVVRKAIQAAAILHWFDRNILNFVLETKLTDAEFSTIISLPYIEEFHGRGWNVHEKTRDMLCDKLWHEDVPLYRKFSRLSATWYRKYNSTDLVWRAEAVYHSLFAGERNAEQAFIDLSIDWLNHYQYDVLESLTRQVLSAAHADRLSKRGCAWALLFKGAIDCAFGRNLEAKDTLINALTIEINDNLFIFNCNLMLGEVCRSLDELPLARQYLEFSLARTLKQTPSEAKCINSLSLVHLTLYEIPQAVTCNESAMRINRVINNRHGIINCIHTRGAIHMATGQFPQAKVDFEKALQMYGASKEQQGEAVCIRSLANLAAEEGNLNAAMAHFDDALKRFDALSMEYEKGLCYNDMGSHYCYSKQFNESIDSYTSAINIVADVNFLTNRAEPYMYLGDFNAAQSDLTAAAAINPSYCYMQFNSGRLELWQGRVESALVFFELAVKQRPLYGEFHLWRAMALFLNGALWENELRTGFACTFLARQIKEIDDALDKLSPIYGGIQLEEPRTILRAELGARISRG